MIKPRHMRDTHASAHGEVAWHGMCLRVSQHKRQAARCGNVRYVLPKYSYLTSGGMQCTRRAPRSTNSGRRVLVMEQATEDLL